MPILPASQRNAGCDGTSAGPHRKDSIQMKTFLPTVIGPMAMATMLSTSPSLASTSEVNEPWCSVDEGATNCLYKSLADCEYVVRPGGGTCIPNPRTDYRPLDELDD